MTVLREFVAKLGLDFDGVSFGIANQAVEALRGGLVRLVQAPLDVVKAMASMVEQSAATGARIDDLANRLGITTDALQELQYAARQSGVEGEALAEALGMVGRKAGEAVTGNKAAAQSFAQLGIALRKSNGEAKDSEELFNDAAAAVAAIKDPTRRLAAAQDLFGRGGRAMVQVLREGTDGLAKLRQQAHDAGAVLGTDFIQNAAKVDDNIVSLKDSLSGLVNNVVGDFLPAIKEATDGMKAWWKENKDWVKKWAVRGVKALVFALEALAVVGIFTALVMSARLTVALGAAALEMAAWTVKTWAQVAAMEWLNIVTIGLALEALALVVTQALVGVGILALLALFALLIEDLTHANSWLKKMTGNWDDLAEAIWNDIDWENHPIKALFQFVAVLIAEGISLVDDFFGRIWEFADAVLSGDIGRALKAFGNIVLGTNAFDASAPDAVTGFTAPTASRQAAANQIIEQKFDIKVEANNQNLDNEKLGGTLQRAVVDAHHQANRDAMRSFAPRSPGVQRGAN